MKDEILNQKQRKQNEVDFKIIRKKECPGLQNQGSFKGRVILSEILDFHVGEQQPDEQN